MKPHNDLDIAVIALFEYVQKRIIGKQLYGSVSGGLVTKVYIHEEDYRYTYSTYKIFFDINTRNTQSSRSYLFLEIYYEDYLKLKREIGDIVTGWGTSRNYEASIGNVLSWDIAGVDRVIREEFK